MSNNQLVHSFCATDHPYILMGVLQPFRKRWLRLSGLGQRGRLDYRPDSHPGRPHYGRRPDRLESRIRS